MWIKVSASQFAKTTGLSHPTVITAYKNLLKLGLILREKIVHDKKGYPEYIYALGYSDEVVKKFNQLKNFSSKDSLCSKKILLALLKDLEEQVVKKFNTLKDKDIKDNINDMDIISEYSQIPNTEIPVDPPDNKPDNTDTSIWLLDLFRNAVPGQNWKPTGDIDTQRFNELCNAPRDKMTEIMTKARREGIHAKGLIGWAEKGLRDYDILYGKKDSKDIPLPEIPFKGKPLVLDHNIANISANDRDHIHPIGRQANRVYPKCYCIGTEDDAMIYNILTMQSESNLYELLADAKEQSISEPLEWIATSEYRC
jgi:DNA-binding Lrp family transcriptional regulator